MHKTGMCKSILSLCSHEAVVAGVFMCKGGGGGSCFMGPRPAKKRGFETYGLHWQLHIS